MKKFLSFVLSAVMLMSVTAGVDLSAYAITRDSRLEHIMTVTNPLYDGIVDSEVLLSKLSGSNELYYENPKVYGSAYTVDKAAAVLRDKMVNRTESIGINVISEKKDISDVANDVLEKAVSQELSVSSSDGDYLLWHWASVMAMGFIVSTGSTNEYHIEFEMGYYTTASQEKEVTSKINSVLKSLDLDGKSDYRKLKLIHNFVCETVNYDYDNMYDDTYTEQFTTYGALIKGQAVCQGYASMFYRLCMEAGISSRVIVGGNHGWNIAKLGSSYYYVDTTWDDTQTDYYPDMTDGSYWSADYTFDWFMKGSDDFTDHYPYDEYTSASFMKKYPVSTVSYVCTHPAYYWAVPKNADCTVGFDKSYSCTECDEVFETVTVEPQTEHNYVKKTVAPTCTAKGYTLYTCSECGMSVKQDEKAALGHSYKKSVTAKATMSSDGKITEACTRCKAVKSTSTIYKILSVALSTTSTYYNGSVKTPSVTVKNSRGTTLKKGTDYDVTYASGRKNVGRYAVTVKFKGNYSGSKTLYFNIIPKGISGIKSITASSKGFTVQWPTQKTQTTGYQIQYSTSSNFSNAKTITMGKPDYYAKKVTGLQGNKKYYVRIRTYKVTKFNGKNYNIYSPWCAAKSVTTKK